MCVFCACALHEKLAVCIICAQACTLEGWGRTEQAECVGSVLPMAVRVHADRDTLLGLLQEVGELEIILDLLGSEELIVELVARPSLRRQIESMQR